MTKRKVEEIMNIIQSHKLISAYDTYNAIEMELLRLK